MLLMVEKGIRGEYVIQFIDKQKLIINILQIMIKMNNREILKVICK